MDGQKELNIQYQTSIIINKTLLEMATGCCRVRAGVVVMACWRVSMSKNVYYVDGVDQRRDGKLAWSDQWLGSLPKCQ